MGKVTSVSPKTNHELKKNTHTQSYAYIKFPFICLDNLKSVARRIFFR